jgi:multimeric flavodoxin WrbA
MQDVNVVVVFHSRLGSTERLALAAAVGAVQGRANIRLRLLPDSADDAAIASMPEWNENRERMNREYVAPREADAVWADALVFGMPAGVESLPREFQSYFASLEALRDAGRLEGKIGAAFTAGLWTEPLYVALRRLGVVTIPVNTGADMLETARLQGRRIAEEARSLRASYPK